MPDSTIWYFIKFFQSEQWADEFVQGKLHLNRLSHFKKIESLYDDDGRPDTNEAVAMWWQPQNFQMDFYNPVFGNIRITEKDLAAPTSLSFEHHNHVHVLCLHAIYTSGLPNVDGEFHLAEGQVDELRRQLRIDPKCLRFGRFVVVVAARQFMERIEGIMKLQGRKWAHGLVRYYDDTQFNGEIPRDRILFSKQKRFEYQKEYRIAVAPTLLGDEPLKLDIGSINDFCFKACSERLSHLLQITQKAM